MRAPFSCSPRRHLCHLDHHLERFHHYCYWGMEWWYACAPAFVVLHRNVYLCQRIPSRCRHHNRRGSRLTWISQSYHLDLDPDPAVLLRGFVTDVPPAIPVGDCEEVEAIRICSLKIIWGDNLQAIHLTSDDVFRRRSMSSRMAIFVESFALFVDSFTTTRPSSGELQMYGFIHDATKRNRIIPTTDKNITNIILHRIMSSIRSVFASYCQLPAKKTPRNVKQIRICAVRQSEKYGM